MGDVEIDFEWVIPESQAADWVAEVESAGGSVSDSGGVYEPRPDEARDYTSAGFEPLSLIAGVAAAGYLLSAIDKMRRNWATKGGVVIDTRGRKVRVRTVPTMRAGQLVVIDPSGTQIFEEPESKEASAVMKAVVEAVGK